MKRGKKEVQITPEEKELLRRLLESPGVEKEWDFFEGMSNNVPPPEYFMREKPDPPYKRVRKVLKACIGVFAFLFCSSVLATFMVPDTAQADKRPFQILYQNVVNGFLRMGPECEDDEIMPVKTTIEREKDIELVGKKIIPELLVSENIPEGYVFKRLKIEENINNSKLANFVYQNDTGETLKIEEFFELNADGSVFNNYIVDAIDKFSFQHDGATGSTILTAWYNNQIHVVITGILEEEELKAIFTSLE